MIKPFFGDNVPNNDLGDLAFALLSTSVSPDTMSIIRKGRWDLPMLLSLISEHPFKYIQQMVGLDTENAQKLGATLAEFKEVKDPVLSYPDICSPPRKKRRVSSEDRTLEPPPQEEAPVRVRLNSVEDFWHDLAHGHSTWMTLNRGGTIVKVSDDPEGCWKGTIKDNEGEYYEVFTGQSLIINKKVTFTSAWLNKAKDVRKVATHLRGQGVKPRVVSL